MVHESDTDPTKAIEIEKDHDESPSVLLLSHNLYSGMYPVVGQWQLFEGVFN